MPPGAPDDSPTQSFAGHERDERLAGLLERLVEELRGGGAPDVEAVAARYPDLAAELRALWSAALAAHLAGGSANVPSSDRLPSTDAGLPRRFGDYELLAELGRGGMGVVYRARQISLAREVALKMILYGRHASPADRARFRAEAQSAARLDHPLIVRIFEVGEEEGLPYFSMERVAGTTLAARLAEGPLPPRAAAQLLAAVARAVHFAHSQGILHRDLKPSNVLIDLEGRPHVTDFGLAKRLSGAESLTRSGAILGTPAYMAPEQAAGGRGALGPATDVYGLGVILYQMLTGRPPFQAPSPVDTLLMVLDHEPVPPRLLGAKVDADLEMIALKCLQKPPELRYATAAALADDLERYLADEPISARSGRFTHVLARAFRPSHHAVVLENWGLLWMWHAAALLALCLLTNGFHLMRHEWPAMERPWPYLALWGGGLLVWAPIFWALRRRAGPVTFVERQIAHVWGASVASALMLFLVERLLGMEVLALAPILGLTNGMVYIVKAGILSGEFYLYAALMFATALVMAALQSVGFDYGISLFGLAAAATFFVPGWKYHRQRRRQPGE